MSPEAWAVAIAAVEADVAESQHFLMEAEANAERADELVGRATERRHEAAERLNVAEEALAYLQSIRQPQQAAEAFGEGQ